MILDTSAIVAVLWNEPDAAEFSAEMSAARSKRISAVTLVETSMVLQRNADIGAVHDFDELIRRSGITVEPVTEEQAYVARQAFLDFGKGRHGARLNLGDCFVYALAKVTGEPLLFKGEDFRKTDVRAAR